MWVQGLECLVLVEHQLLKKQKYQETTQNNQKQNQEQPQLIRQDFRGGLLGRSRRHHRTSRAENITDFLEALSNLQRSKAKHLLLLSSPDFEVGANIRRLFLKNIPYQ